MESYALISRKVEDLTEACQTGEAEGQPMGRCACSVPPRRSLSTRRRQRVFSEDAREKPDNERDDRSPNRRRESRTRFSQRAGSAVNEQHTPRPQTASLHCYTFS